jgi:NAD(P)-dependent dehydrogenase (short-subunit alcohol dehydrogenase family)
MFSLSGKVAVVTGGGSGIGKAILSIIWKAGASVHILELNASAGESSVAEIIEAGGQAQVHACDVSNQAQVSEVIKSIGKVDVLVNNAGIAHVGSLENCDSEAFERVYSVNVKGVYNTLYAVVPVMKANGGGVILNMASIASSIGLPDRFAYSMSKGAVLTMTLSVAKDYIKNNIRCNCISPARVHTPFVMVLLLKITRVAKRKCLRNFQLHSQLGVWQNRKK